MLHSLLYLLDNIMEEEETFTRTKMMEEINYVPYCGADKCMGRWPRMIRTDKGCKCQSCGFEFELPQEFIDRYNAKWNVAYPFISKLKDDADEHTQRNTQTK